jgi:ribosomal peptide maturation radical SAM protein 1
MPFASAERPSIQIGLLKAIAEEAGFSTDAYHFNLDLAAELSPEVYELFCQHRGHMTGEWLFAPAAFGLSMTGDEESYFQAFPDEVKWARKIGRDQAYFFDLRNRIIPLFIDKCVAEIEWRRFRVVGFTSTFQQNVASLALARRIKKCYPDVNIVFGGANMEGEMGGEFARAFPFVDYVVSGEGDVVFPALLGTLAAKSSPLELPGLITNNHGRFMPEAQALPILDLDSLPVANYEAYFERASILGLSSNYQATWTLPFESSRGCWWGQKRHCTFCGLNGLGINYRSKSPKRVMDELSKLTRKYRISAFTAVDNILDWKYIPQLFTQLAENKTDYLFFYELKANLSRQQIQMLYRGGVRSVQPGIESMSTHVLQLMRKGSNMLQNVRCLKWCLYYNIHVDWNLIWGFPGETEEDYAKEFEVLQCITHLEPPIACSQIWLERFSPYYTDRNTFPVRNVRPEASYYHVYPSYVNVEKIAYFFDYEMGHTVPVEVHEPTQALVHDWQQCWKTGRRHALSYRRTSDSLLIDFNRGSERQGTYCLSGAPALIYEVCVETMQSVNQVVTYLRDSPEKYDYPAEEVRAALDDFCRARLMLGEDDKYLSLAIPSNPNW